MAAREVHPLLLLAEKGDHEAMIKLAKGPGQESCWKATNGRGQNCFIVLTRRNHLVCLKKLFSHREGHMLQHASERAKTIFDEAVKEADLNRQRALHHAVCYPDLL